MTRDDLLKRFDRQHAVIVVNLENYVREHGGYVDCKKKVRMRYMDSTDENTDTVYQFDHIYADDFDVYAVYTEETELGEIELKYLSCDELYELICDIEETEPKRDYEIWQRYIDYLHNWADCHAGSVNSGMSPVSFDEWCDNEKEIEE